MDINNSLLKSIQTIVNNAIKVAPFNKTRQAQILANNGNGTYTIKLDGVLYNNVPAYPTDMFMKVGNIVKVVVPGNQYSHMYIVSLTGNKVDMINPIYYLEYGGLDAAGYATTGADKRLYNAIHARGWDDEVLVSL